MRGFPARGRGARGPKRGKKKRIEKPKVLTEKMQKKGKRSALFTQFRVRKEKTPSLLFSENVRGGTRTF